MADAAVNATSRTFSLPFDPALAALVPNVEQYDDPKAGRMLRLPHTVEATRLARNLKHKVPAPIMSQYVWPKSPPPFRTQKLTAALLTMNRRAYVLSEMGTGKSRAALFAIDYLLQARIATKALLVVPLSTMTPVWDLELMVGFPHLSVGTLYGTRERRLRELAKNCDVYIINHDGVQSILPELTARKDIDIVLVDEISFFRNAQTDRWKAMYDLLTPRKYVWGMTGSPVPNAPTDAWAQCRLITPKSVPAKFRYFRDATMYKVSQFVWRPRAGALDLVYEAMQPGVRFRREEVVELPPVNYITRTVEMSTEQNSAYKKLMDFARVSYQDGEVTAANEGVLFSKLLQVSSGWVYTTTKDVVDLNPAKRLDALMEIIDEAESKIIVFVSFKHSAQFVMEALEGHKAYSGQLRFVTGDTPKTARDQIFADFQKPGGPRILVAHPQCMAHGLTLTAASVIVWYTLTTSLDIYQQACARITRPGQKLKQLIVHLIGSGIEKKIYSRLKANASVQGALLEMFETE